MTDSRTLLADYAKSGSEAAFRELVSRYIDLVYSTALRLVGGDTHLAQDVVQTVFVHLARTARGLSGEVMLGGWLHRDTCNVAANLMRGERRRQSRERQAMEMHAQQDHTQANLAKVAPVLDEAINQLGEEDRTAILLRFYEQKDFRFLGGALGSTEDAARMRVSRALDKLQVLLKHRGVTLSAAALGTVLTTETLTAAPGNLATRIAASAFAEAAFGGGSIIALLQLMSKLKTVGIAGLGVLATVSIGFYFGSRNPERPQAAPEPSPGALTADIIQQVNATVPRQGFSKPAKPPERLPEIQAAIVNLWQALRAEPVDDNGYVSPHKVNAALQAFGADIQEAIPTLLEGLQDTSGQVQMCAMWGFNFMGKRAEPAIPALLDLACSQTQRHNTRVFAIQALGVMALEYGTGKTAADGAFISVAVPDLINLLQDRNVELRGDVARALGKMGSYAKEAVPALAELLTYSATPEDTQAVAERQGRSGSAPGDSKLEDQMNRLTGSIRLSAAEALGRMGQDAEAAVAQLSEQLNNPDISVRTKSAIALWRTVGRTDVVEVLAASIYPPKPDSDWQERVEVLGEMGPAAAASIPNLQQLCKFRNPEIREPVLAALGKIDSTAAANLRPPIESK